MAERDESGKFAQGHTPYIVTAYTQELGERICAEMIGGEDGRPKSLNTVLKMADMPSKRTVMTWLHRHPEFEKIYRIAQQERAECWIEDIVDIADDSSLDYTTDSEGNLRVDKEHINRSRLRVDTRKWVAAKMMPKLYGDRVEITGEIIQRDVSDQPFTDEQWSEQYARPTH